MGHKIWDLQAIGQYLVMEGYSGVTDRAVVIERAQDNWNVIRNL